jgi:hypothetical protein
VHLLVASRGSSGPRLAAELREGGHAVSHVEADLGSLDSVRSAAMEIRERLERGDLPRLRGFVGNAGVQYTRRTCWSIVSTADGRRPCNARFSRSSRVNAVPLFSSGSRKTSSPRAEVT